MKKGFTIAEILITMGIIGVAAALVLPNMVSKINRNTVGITLSRAVELTEKGFADMLSVARENAANATDFNHGEELIDPGSISRLSMLQKRFFDGVGGDFILENPYELIDRASSYIGVDNIDDNVGDYSDLLANAGLFANGFLLQPTFFKLKKINAYLIFDDDGTNDVNIADDPDIVIRRIFFDTNGENAPNEVGEDIFLFGLTDSGHLVPAGSSAYLDNLWDNALGGGLSVPILDGNDPNGTCSGTSIPNNNIIARLSCAARVVQDGWRVNYSY